MPDGLASSPYLNLPLRELAEVKAARLVRLALTLSRAAADRGDEPRARRWWGWAARLSYRCGGISGCVLAGDGYMGIVLADGLVAWSPVKIKGDAR